MGGKMDDSQRRDEANAADSETNGALVSTRRAVLTLIGSVGNIPTQADHVEYTELPGKCDEH